MKLLAEGLTVEPVWVFGLLTGAGGVIGTLFWLLKGNYDKQLEEKDTRIKALQSVADEAVKAAIETANYYRAKDGKPPIIPLAPVVAEGSSPPNLKQRRDAEMQTFRATIAALKLAEGLEPRKEPGKKEES